MLKTVNNYNNTYCQNKPNDAKDALGKLNAIILTATMYLKFT